MRTSGIEMARFQLPRRLLCDIFSASTKVADMTQAQRQSGTFAADFETLQASMRGQALSPAAPDYEAARKVFNGMIDRRPALIVRCAGVADVMRALEFGVGKSLPISIRCGGHSVAGFSVCEGGVMLDLTPM